MKKIKKLGIIALVSSGLLAIQTPKIISRYLEWENSRSYAKVEVAVHDGDYATAQQLLESLRDELKIEQVSELERKIDSLHPSRLEEYVQTQLSYLTKELSSLVGKRSEEKEGKVGLELKTLAESKIFDAKNKVKIDSKYINEFLDVEIDYIKKLVDTQSLGRITKENWIWEERLEFTAYIECLIRNSFELLGKLDTDKKDYRALSLLENYKKKVEQSNIEYRVLNIEPLRTTPIPDYDPYQPVGTLRKPNMSHPSMSHFYYEERRKSFMNPDALYNRYESFAKSLKEKLRNLEIDITKSMGHRALNRLGHNSKLT